MTEYYKILNDFGAYKLKTKNILGLFVIKIVLDFFSITNTELNAVDIQIGRFKTIISL